MKVRPKKIISITLSYDCVNCGNDKWLDNIEAKTPGFKFVCPVCQYVNEIEPVKIVCNVKPISHISPISPIINTKIKSGEINRGTDREIDSKVVKIIQTYGHTKKEGRQFVDKAREYLLSQ